MPVHGVHVGHHGIGVSSAQLGREIGRELQRSVSSEMAGVVVAALCERCHHHAVFNKAHPFGVAVVPVVADIGRQGDILAHIEAVGQPCIAELRKVKPGISPPAFEG